MNVQLILPFNLDTRSICIIITQMIDLENLRFKLFSKDEPPHFVYILLLLQYFEIAERWWCTGSMEYLNICSFEYCISNTLKFQLQSK